MSKYILFITLSLGVALAVYGVKTLVKPHGFSGLALDRDGHHAEAGQVDIDLLWRLRIYPGV